MDELRCREVVEFLTDYLEGALPAAVRDHLALHLAGCRGCADHLEQLLVTIRLLGDLPGEAVSRPPVRGARGSSPGRR